jgi:hypothetical protein
MIPCEKRSDDVIFIIPKRLRYPFTRIYIVLSDHIFAGRALLFCWTGF